METTKGHGKRVGKALERLYDGLKVIRDSASWQRKLDTCSYMHHRDDYPGTMVKSRVTHDSTARDYFDTFKNGFVGYLMPRDDDWGALMLHGRGTSGSAYDVFDDVDMEPGLLKMLERASQMVLSTYASSNYYKAVDECFTDMLMTGDGYMMAVDDWEHGKVYYKTFDPQEVVVACNSRQELEVFVRKFRMDAVDVSRDWRGAELPKVRRMAEVGTGEERNVDMMEAILPSRYLYDLKEEKYFDFGTGKAFVHLIYCEMDECLVSVSGYDEMPVGMAAHDEGSSATPYAKGMAEKALEEIIKLDDMANLRQEQFQKNVRPAWVLPYALKNSQFSSRPDKKNFVPEMTQRPMPLQDGHSYNEMLNDINDQKANLRGIFQVDLFRTLLGNHDSRKTAYEVSQLKNESMTLLATRIGNLHKDLIEPIWKRTLKILARNGAIAESGKLQRFEAFVDTLSLELNSVFVRRLSAYLQYEGIMATHSFLTAVGQIAPDALVNIDMDKFVRQGIVASGSPRAVLRDLSEVKKIKERQAQMLAQQREAELAEQGAQTNLANSRAIAEGAGGREMPPQQIGGPSNAYDR